jgi:hypothetical protein
VHARLLKPIDGSAGQAAECFWPKNSITSHIGATSLSRSDRRDKCCRSLSKLSPLAFIATVGGEAATRGLDVFDDFFPKLPHAGTAQTGRTMLGLLMSGALMMRLCRRVVLVGGLSVLLVMTFAGCGSGSSSPPSSNNVAAKGSYTVTIIGTDTTASSLTATTTMTLTID